MRESDDWYKVSILWPRTLCYDSNTEQWSFINRSDKWFVLWVLPRQASRVPMTWDTQCILFSNIHSTIVVKYCITCTMINYTFFCYFKYGIMKYDFIWGHFGQVVCFKIKFIPLAWNCLNITDCSCYLSW